MELITKIICLTAIIIVISIENTLGQAQYVGNNILDIDPPKFYILNPSPLRNRENLRQEQYFNFLNTLYRNDRSKSNLFANRPEGTLQNLHRQRRTNLDDSSILNIDSISTSNSDSSNTAAIVDQQFARSKRAIVFRPLFVYRQQETKRQRIAEERRRRYRH